MLLDMLLTRDRQPFNTTTRKPKENAQLDWCAWKRCMKRSSEVNLPKDRHLQSHQSPDLRELREPWSWGISGYSYKSAH